jgi:hypothetical protein
MMRRGFFPGRSKCPERSAEFRPVSPECASPQEEVIQFLGKRYALCPREAGHMSSSPAYNARKIVHNEWTLRDYQIYRSFPMPVAKHAFDYAVTTGSKGFGVNLECHQEPQTRQSHGRTGCV